MRDSAHDFESWGNVKHVSSQPIDRFHHTKQNENLMSRLFIIDGCNGAGKTTASKTILPEILDCREFVRSQMVARGGKGLETELFDVNIWGRIRS